VCDLKPAGCVVVRKIAMGDEGEDGKGEEREAGARMSQDERVNPDQRPDKAHGLFSISMTLARKPARHI
jgi:hypothetical protein